MLNAIEKTPFVGRRARIAAFVLWTIASLAALATPVAVAQEQDAAEQGTEPEFVEPLNEPMAVIPPGKEDFFAEMLGRGATLPNQCAFAAGQIAQGTVTVTYACPDGEVGVALGHPSAAASGATVTEQFALTVKSGSPPAGLVDALAERIRSREKGFEWTWLGPTVSTQSSRVIIVVLVLFVGVLWLVVRRTRRRAEAP